MSMSHLQSDLSKPLHMEDIDSSSGLLIPFLDADTNVVYVAGKVLHTCVAKFEFVLTFVIRLLLLFSHCTNQHHQIYKEHNASNIYRHIKPPKIIKRTIHKVKNTGII